MIFTQEIGVAVAKTLIQQDTPSSGYTTTYLCYPNSNGGLDPLLNCAIQKVVSSVSGQDITWANGDMVFNKNWNTPTAYTYSIIGQ